MKLVCAFSLAACAVLWLLTGVASAQGQFGFSFSASPMQPTPDLGPTQSGFDPNAFDCIQNDGAAWPAGSLADVIGLASVVARGAYFCRIEQLDPGITTAAQGWQMGFSVTGCNGVILAVTATQTDIAPGTIEDCELGPGGTGGFDATEITTGPGNEGAVHSIVLHLKRGTTLDPTGSNTTPATGPEQNPVTVCRFLLESQNPDTAGETCDMTLAFVDGLSGTGQPLENKVTQDGLSVLPTLTNEVISKSVPLEVPVGTLKFSEPVSDVSPCEQIAVKVLLSNTCGVSGFTFGVSHDGSVLQAIDASPSGVTNELNLGQGPDFWFMDVNPDVTNCSSTAGVVVAMIAFFGNPFLLTIPIGDDQEIVTITYEPVAGVAQGSQTPLEFVECLRAVQDTEPTLTTVTCGVTVRTPLTESGMVRIGADCFQRGDCNNDGQLDMSDAVTALLHLFAEGQIVVPVTCLDACDGNDDGELDISDPIRELDWIFNGGPALPPPFLTCDVDGTVDALGCELFSFCED